MGFFFYQNRKPRQFHHIPILYDPEQEERKKKLQQRIEEIKREMGVLPPLEGEEKTDFKSEFLSQTRHLKRRMERKDAGKQPFFTNNGLLFVIILILLAIFYFWILR